VVIWKQHRGEGKVTEGEDRKVDTTPLSAAGRPPTTGEDVFTLVREVLREAYLEAAEELRIYAEKVREINRRKKALRGYLTALRKFKASVLSTARERGVDLCRGDDNDLAMLAQVFEEHAYTYDVGEVEYQLCVPNRVPPTAVKSVVLLDNEIACWEERLATLGDVSELSAIELQNAVQKTQQNLQMLSNVSKMAHDSIMAIIRKIGG
jgi:hypothetical protein